MASTPMIMLGNHARNNNNSLPSPVPERLKHSLFEAARTGNADSLESGLRQHEEAIHVTNAEDGFTLLHAATNAGQRYIVNLLVKNKADLNAVSRAGYTALMLATAGHRPYIMADLIEAGASPDGNPRRLQSQGCLHIAATHDDQGDMGPLHMLLIRGADVNVKDAEGRTPLHVAIRNERLQAAKALVAFGVDPKIADKQGKTAHDYASEMPEQTSANWTTIFKNWGKPRKQRSVRRSFEQMTSLRRNWRGQFRGMSFGGLLGSPNGQFDWIYVLSRVSGLELSRSAYDSAADRPGEPREFCQDWRPGLRSHNALLKYALSIPIDSIANRGDLLLDHLLHRYSHGLGLASHKVLGRLLQLGANPNAVLPIREHARFRPTPLDDSFLVLHGHGFTPLHVAVSRAVRSGTVELLLDHGADVEARTDEGLTPFLLAAQRGSHADCEVLVERGADVDARAHDGRDVYDILRGPSVGFRMWPDSMSGRRKIEAYLKKRQP
ncbi:hypothetical protein PG985_014702 [Apiospora marii]|uniref:uncharacterized protein n=1 Tax=Apiospora marii TaxID=335849 RepID=UPI003130D696